MTHIKLILFSIIISFHLTSGVTYAYDELYTYNSEATPYIDHELLTLLDLQNHIREEFTKKYPGYSPGKIRVHRWSSIWLVRGVINGSSANTLLFVGKLECDGYGISKYSELEINELENKYLYLFPIPEGIYRDIESNTFFEVPTKRKRRKKKYHGSFGVRIARDKARIYYSRRKDEYHVVKYPIIVEQPEVKQKYNE